MTAVTLESFTLDECPSCPGVWFDLDGLAEVTGLGRKQLSGRFGPG